MASRAGAGRLFTYLGDAPQPAPGVFETGDLGRLDADGFLSLAGRADDVVLSGGVNVYPAEVEAALMAHPDVVEAAVCGLPDPEWGEVVAAAVVASATPAALSAWCRARLGSIRAPRVVIRVAALPRTPGGKVARAALRRALTTSGK